MFALNSLPILDFLGGWLGVLNKNCKTRESLHQALAVHSPTAGHQVNMSLVKPMHLFAQTMLSIVKIESNTISQIDSDLWLYKWD